MINWSDLTKEESEQIHKIADKACHLRTDLDPAMIDMDLAAVHVSGNKLDLAAMLEADDFNLLHDIFGIARPLDRPTGQLKSCFSPRFSARTKQ